MPTRSRRQHEARSWTQGCGWNCSSGATAVVVLVRHGPHSLTLPVYVSTPRTWIDRIEFAAYSCRRTPYLEEERRCEET